MEGHGDLVRLQALKRENREPSASSRQSGCGIDERGALDVLGPVYLAQDGGRAARTERGKCPDDWDQLGHSRVSMTQDVFLGRREPGRVGGVERRARRGSGQRQVTCTLPGILPMGGPAALWLTLFPLIRWAPWGSNPQPAD